MSYLLDTNLVSERLRKTPNQAVLDWVTGRPNETLFISVVTLAEIQFGASRLDQGRRRDRLERWTFDLISATGERLLPVDLHVSLAWGRIRAETSRAGRLIPAMDGFLAATAEVHGLTVVTRNVKDFEVWGGPVLNPWSIDPPA